MIAAAYEPEPLALAAPLRPLRPRPWLIGENNPYGCDPSYALYPHPRGAAGDRLRVILGLTDAEYLSRFERRNLIDRGRVTAARMREAAEDVQVASRGAPLVLLGARVAKAFGREYLPFVIHAERQPLLILPHPSGRCRAWNDPRSTLRARTMVRELEALR